MVTLQQWYKTGLKDEGRLESRDLQHWNQEGAPWGLGPAGCLRCCEAQGSPSSLSGYPEGWNWLFTRTCSAQDLALSGFEL